jgi:hypothetical protein
MPTDIFFAADNLALRVNEEPSQVAQALTDARGLPFRLTGQTGREVYVNPGAVAFWLAPGASPPPEPAQAPQHFPARRQAVTDIWGRPLRGKGRD